MPDRFVISPAGSGKTGEIIGEALKVSADKKVLITTYTNENIGQISRRITQKVGCVPENIDLLTWFQFLLRDGIKPYQSYVTDIGSTQSVNYLSENPPFAKRSEIERYYFDKVHNVFSDAVSDLVCVINEKSDGLVIDRVESIYDEIYIDELQDLVGYDLEFIALLLESQIRVTAVGDPRQHTYSTNRSNKNKKYRGPGLMEWVEKRVDDTCSLEIREHSQRCHQSVCDFASALYPDFPAMTSLNDEVHDHFGIFLIAPEEVRSYVEIHSPQVLRYRSTDPTANLQALNIGVAKGSTYDHVLIFPTKTMLKYLRTSNLSHAGDVAKLYVAATRARFSVAFVQTESSSMDSSIATRWTAS